MLIYPNAKASVLLLIYRRIGRTKGVTRKISITRFFLPFVARVWLWNPSLTYTQRLCRPEIPI